MYRPRPHPLCIGDGLRRQEPSEPGGKTVAFIFVFLFVLLCLKFSTVHIYVCTYRRPYRSCHCLESIGTSSAKIISQMTSSLSLRRSVAASWWLPPCCLPAAETGALGRDRTYPSVGSVQTILSYYRSWATSAKTQRTQRYVYRLDNDRVIRSFMYVLQFCIYIPMYLHKLYRTSRLSEPSRTSFGILG